MSGTSEPVDADEQADSDDAAQPSDEVRRRFREALDRKQAKAKSGEEHANGPSKIHQTHGPAGAKRTFRRKSG
jgi:Family of unknown function (DUF5302)